MTKTVITEYTYIFYCDGAYFEQNTFRSDSDALAHAKSEAEKRGKPVKVARWLDADVYEGTTDDDMRFLKTAILVDFSNNSDATIIAVKGMESGYDHLRIYTQSKEQRENAVATLKKIFSEEVPEKTIKKGGR